jgi:hypothetical protein
MASYCLLSPPEANINNPVIPVKSYDLDITNLLTNEFLQRVVDHIMNVKQITIDSAADVKALIYLIFAFNYNVAVNIDHVHRWVELRLPKYRQKEQECGTLFNNIGNFFKNQNCLELLQIERFYASQYSNLQEYRRTLQDLRAQEQRNKHVYDMMRNDHRNMVEGIIRARDTAKQIYSKVCTTANFEKHHEDAIKIREVKTRINYIKIVMKPLEGPEYDNYVLYMAIDLPPNEIFTAWVVDSIDFHEKYCRGQQPLIENEWIAAFGVKPNIIA